MAADSRLSLNAKVGEGADEKTITFDFSNSTNKVFCTKRGVGISTCGNADIQGKPIAGFIEHFILENNDAFVDDVAKKLLSHFRDLQPELESIFHVCGYDSEGKQRIYKVNTESNKTEESNPGFFQGAIWDGESDVLIRLIQQCWLAGADGKPEQSLVTYPIPWNFFSLQDAIDFATFAMSVTIGTIRFQNRLKTVGGPVDVLAIKPGGAVWVQRKTLHA